MKKSLFTILIVAILITPANLYAVGSGGFENASFSARSLAESNAVVAQADEPAAISYNPAGITQLDGFQAQGSSAFISAFTFHRGLNGEHDQSALSSNVEPFAHLH